MKPENARQVMTLKVSEIWFSLQGEGLRTGVPTIFIRLQGCKTKMACAASGVVCDTEFESGKEMTIQQIKDWIKENANTCNEITWTGGEPTDQLTSEILREFNTFYQTIETSGLNPVPKGIHFISLSPKVAEHIIAKNFPKGVNELRYVRHSGQDIPQPSIKADYYYLSPHSDGYTINDDNVKHCIKLCLKHPQWRLSIQDHKLWKLL